MADPGDFRFLRRLLADGTVSGSVLEIGSLNHQGHDEGNAKHTCEAAGLKWEGADFAQGRDVDIVFDVLDREAIAALGRTWDSVLLFNLLEHVYDPIAALRNAMSLVADGGVLAIAGPVIWEVHDYPADFWRPMPGFFLEFARREGLTVVPGSPTWIVNDRLVGLDDLRDGEQHLAPSVRHLPAIYGTRRRGLVAGGLHRLSAALGFGGLVFPFAAFGIALRR